MAISIKYFALILFLGSSCVMYTDRPGPADEPYRDEPTRQPLSNAAVELQNYDQEGIASFMADEMQGRKTASGIPFNLRQLVAAHPTLPFGTRVKVINLGNGKTVDVTIVDRGPFVKDRVIDVSFAAAKQLEFIEAGMTRVRVSIIRLGNGKVDPEAL